MFRHAMKYLLAACVTVTLVASFAPAGAATAAESPPSASADCSGERAVLITTATKAKKRIAQLEKAKNRVAKARKALRKSERARSTDKASKQLKQARAAKRTATVRQQRAMAQVRLALARYQACENGTGTGPSTGPTPAPGPDADPTPGPLQPICDAGLPQAICAALDGLPLPGGAGGASPIQPLCDAGLPQAICAAATGLPLPGGASAIQPLCNAGLPQGICDVAAGTLNAGSLPIPAGLPGLPAFAFPGVPDVSGLDLLIGLLSPVTGVLPLGTICATIDIPIVCDLVTP